ncbi:hypothetical protein NB476_16110 [Vibrio sp. RM-44-3]|uniref:hypothetical protein n=1 Tax=unclassified Vibrio TaxID=2614977 RepID=UPI00215D166F|nr:MULTISPECIES: hypothetical protein [unclassified Vibrio]MCR9550675.1 hypothetical protein [Vibrio sp. RM-41-2A]MCR9556248.1 hypothetical protein [Vibrio sp. RM-41-2B]MCR9623857.1 hypothetical protein [Vibrio sp. RM-44-3]
MIDAVCTYGGKRKTYNIFNFQKLSNSDIEKYRQHLECPNPKCSAEAYYRKKSVDGKAACFGSRYHVQGCDEGRSSPQREREIKHALEVDKIIADSSEVIFDFFAADSKPSGESNIARPSRPKSTETGSSKSHTGAVTTVRNTVLGMEKALNSLMRGSDLAHSDTIITIDEKYPYKAKNLFVNFADAEPADNPKDARPKMFWGTISHSDADLEWLNPADCDDVGIPIKRHKDKLFKRFKITERRDLEGAGFILFGKCFWNAQKTRKIIELWNADRIFISVDED